MIIGIRAGLLSIKYKNQSIAGAHGIAHDGQSLVEVFLERFPDFELDLNEEVTWATGQVRGPRRLPIRILSSKD